MPFNANETYRKMFGGPCLTPGGKIRSGGSGRGYAAGYGRGPIGRPSGRGYPLRENICPTPGMGIRSGGRGRGLARGGGRGPMAFRITKSREFRPAR